MFTVKLMLFGLFRKNISSDSASFSVKKGTNLSELKKIISDSFIMDGDFEKAKSVNESVFADEHEIILSDFIIDNNMTLSILPPVSGG